MATLMKRWMASLIGGVAPRLSFLVLYGFCELRSCWEPACVGVLDIREGQPTEDGFRTWSKEGPSHYFCDKHARPGLEYNLDGTVTVTAPAFGYGG